MVTTLHSGPAAILAALATIVAQSSWAAPRLDERQARAAVEEIGKELKAIPLGRYEVVGSLSDGKSIDFKARKFLPTDDSLAMLQYLSSIGLLTFQVVNPSQDRFFKSPGAILQIDATEKGLKLQRSTNQKPIDGALLIPTCSARLKRIVQLYPKDKGPESYTGIYWTQSIACSPEYSGWIKQLGLPIHGSAEELQCSALSKYDKFAGKWGGLSGRVCSEPGQPLGSDFVKAFLDKQ